MFKFTKINTKIFYYKYYMNIIYTIFLTIIIIIVVLLCLSAIESLTNINYHEKFNPELYKLPANYIGWNKDNFIENVTKGHNIAKKSKIVICSLARNIEKIFPKTRIRLEHIGEQFNEYKIVLFENDSTDNSRELIKNWSNENKNIILLNCCDLGNCDCRLKNKTGYQYGTFSEERLSKMAVYREQYLKYVQEYLFDYDYMLVVDFDLDGNTNIYGLFDSLSKDNWGAIFSNGKNPVPGTFGFGTIIYDPMATLFINEDYGIEKYDINKILIKFLQMQYYSYNNHFLEVKSSFNGYGLYKIKSILGCSYIGNNNACEHINLHKCLFDKQNKLYINYFWEGFFNSQGDTFLNVLKKHLL